MKAKYCKEYKTAVNLVLSTFDGDIYKTISWFGTENPHLGGITATRMINSGRVKKLLSFIKSCIDENLE